MKFACLFSLCIPLLALGQSDTAKKNFTWSYDWKSNNSAVPESPYNLKGALKDIENNTLKLVFNGGFLGVKFDESKASKFQEDYKVDFIVRGCTRQFSDVNEDVKTYNNTILQYLSNRFSGDVYIEYYNLFETYVP
ncbi:MAG: hypothetical protein MRY83_11505 [Flavobacteriales bacterium]|nr:hypothetical protein [Flavobacteriales bacterium]